ncbi:hypothetical protein EON64_17785 [archaeon]|nr:MAG: hypothetical protein EON64_17785 [archaeon]
MKNVFLVVNMGAMVFMAATGAIGIANTDSINDTGVIFVGIYMLLFASVQFVFEISQLCPSSSLNTVMKKNFGFLYGTIGKGLFMLFMGILAFGLNPSGKQAKSMAIACGILVSAWGVLLILIYLKVCDVSTRYNIYMASCCILMPPFPCL